jgi:hypothetical protein
VAGSFPVRRGYGGSITGCSVFDARPIQRDYEPRKIGDPWHARKEARIREGVVIADVYFPGERPAANGHLLHSRHHPRRRSNPAATPGHVATSRGALPGGSYPCRPRSCQRRQRHAGLAESPSQSSVFLYVSIVKIVGEFRDTQPLRQASPHADVMCGQASAGGASAKPVHHASLALRIRGASDQARRRKGTTRRDGSPAQQPEGSRRLARRPISPRVLRRA